MEDGNRLVGQACDPPLHCVNFRCGIYAVRFSQCISDDCNRVCLNRPWRELKYRAYEIWSTQINASALRRTGILPPGRANPRGLR
jgi:hypothetical protein